MEVRRLYYEDSHIKIFDAVVTGCTATTEAWDITLDATAFYPEGGGQPCDRGVLGGQAVLAVREEGGNVIHTCEGPLKVGSTVSGAIDWQRRFDLMQQHSGEHMVSGTVHRLYGYHNVGFHIGADTVTVDFDGPVPAEDLEKIEDAVNAAIWENLPVRCFYPDKEALQNYPYRRKKDLPWPVRLVEFPGIDLCACCGTQVQRTGEIGLVKLLSCVKFHEGVRIEMVCGKRALTCLNTAFAQNRLVSQAFSAKPEQTGLAARRMNDALSAEKFRVEGLQRKLFAAIAAQYAGKEAVLHFEKDLSPSANRSLCDAIAAVCPLAVTLSGEDETGYSLYIICANGTAKALGEKAISAFSGKGGGKSNAFQGSISGKKEEIFQFFSSALFSEK